MFELSDKPIIKIDRRTLEKVFPDNESLKKFEELIRVLNNLVPEDLQNIYSFIEDNNNYSITIDSKLNSIISKTKDLTNNNQAVEDNNNYAISIDSKLNSIISKLKDLSNTNRASGTFVTADRKTVTVKNGLITNII